MSSLEVPTSFLNNLETIINHQNIKLITEICKWKGWNSQEIINEFMGEENKKKITKTRIRNNLDTKNNSFQNSKPGNCDSNTLNNLEIRYRNICFIGNQRYYIESPTNNVYTIDGDYKGKMMGENIDYDAEED